MSTIIGISAYYHDSAVALIKDGEIIFAVQEERFSRIKHDSNFPVKSLNYLIEHYRNKIINIHPSLLPKFKGLNTFSRILENKEIKAGCTVHYVNEKLDSGSKIIQKSFLIDANDDPNILKEKTQKLEYKAFPEAIIKIFRNY